MYTCDTCSSLDALLWLLPLGRWQLQLSRSFSLKPGDFESTLQILSQGVSPTNTNLPLALPLRHKQGHVAPSMFAPMHMMIQVDYCIGLSPAPTTSVAVIYS